MLFDGNTALRYKVHHCCRNLVMLFMTASRETFGKKTINSSCFAIAGHEKIGGNQMLPQTLHEAAL